MAQKKQENTMNDYFHYITYLFEEMKRLETTMKEAANEEEFAENIAEQKSPYFEEAYVYAMKFDQKFPLIITPSGGLQQRDFLKIIAVASTCCIRVEYYKKESFIFPINNLNNTKDFLDWLITNELTDKITPELFRDHYSYLATAVGFCGCCDD